jgi:hypothetical protein
MTAGGGAAGRAGLLALGAALAAGGCSRSGPGGRAAERWVLDGTASVRGLRPQVLGSPNQISMAAGDALCFDGDDGLVLARNPIEGLGAFTLEVLLRVDAMPAGVLDEPRFLHIEAGDGARVTMEARVRGASWYLDTFLRAGDQRRALAEPSKVHPTGRWTWTALTYDGARMRHFVDGVAEAEGPVSIPPLGPGKVSLAVRQNLVHWLKGCIRELRVTPSALSAAELQR